jgi:hypothetical protein
MRLVQYKNKWVVYDNDGHVVVICTNKHIAIKYAKEQTNAS